VKFHYDWVATRAGTSAHGDQRRITDRLRDGSYALDPAVDRVMLCGSMAMIKQTAELLDGFGLRKGPMPSPGTMSWNAPSSADVRDRHPVPGPRSRPGSGSGRRAF
jgi:NAD(P)H-flavin reductase